MKVNDTLEIKHIFVTTTLKLGCHGNFGPGATVRFIVQVEYHVEVCGEYEKTRKTMPVGRKAKTKAEMIPFPGPSTNHNSNCKHQALTIWLRATADDCSALYCL